MQSPSTRYWIAVGLAVCLSALGACTCNGSASSASEKDDGERAEASEPSGEQGGGEESGGEGSEESDAPPEDLYPGMNFGELESEDRETFVSVAKAELCPCPQSTESLHKCLQARDATCGLAKRSATAVAKGLQAGLSKSDLQGRLAELIERSKKEHEFTLEGVPHKGPEDAPVTIVEFADFKCPHCRKAAGLLDELRKEYDGKIVQYFKYFPLSKQGTSRLTAQAAAAAHQQGKFWPMHDLIFEHQRDLTRDKIMGFARRIGLNFEKFKNDMQGDEVAQAIARDKKEGNRAGIRGTPAIYVNGREYMGEITKNSLKDMIDTALEADEGGE